MKICLSAFLCPFALTQQFFQSLNTLNTVTAVQCMCVGHVCRTNLIVSIDQNYCRCCYYSYYKIISKLSGSSLSLFSAVAGQRLIIPFWAPLFSSFAQSLGIILCVCMCPTSSESVSLLIVLFILFPFLAFSAN